MKKEPAVLTQEQKALLPKLRRNRALILVGILVLLLAVVLYAVLSCKQAERNYQQLAQESDRKLAAGTIDQNLISERTWAKQVMEQAQNRKPVLLLVGILCATCGTVLCLVYYKLSYPWLSKSKI